MTNPPTDPFCEALFFWMTGASQNVAITLGVTESARLVSEIRSLTKDIGSITGVSAELLAAADAALARKAVGSSVSEEEWARTLARDIIRSDR